MDYQNLPLEYSTPPNFKHIEEEPRGVGLIKELSPQEHVKELIMWLQGLMWDNNKKEYIKVMGVDSFMNEEGINMFFHYATSIISPIITLSDYGRNTELIHNMIKSIVKDASAHFHIHYKDYGIKRKTQIRVLTNKLMTLGLSSFYKAIGGGDRKAATQNITENINTMTRNQQIQPQRRGFFSRFSRGQENYG